MIPDRRAPGKQSCGEFSLEFLDKKPPGRRGYTGRWCSGVRLGRRRCLCGVGRVSRNQGRPGRVPLPTGGCPCHSPRKNWAEGVADVIEHARWRREVYCRGIGRLTVGCGGAEGAASSAAKQFVEQPMAGREEVPWTKDDLGLNRLMTAARPMARYSRTVWSSASA